MKTIVLGGVVSLMVIAPLTGRVMMPSLERVRNKVDSALKGQEPGKTVSFKEWLAQQKGGGEEKVFTPSSVSSSSGTKLIDAMTVQSLEQEMNGLYWSNQTELVEQCMIEGAKSPAQVLVILKNKIDEHCAKCRAPFVVFARELGQEEQMLDALFLKLLNVSDQKNTLVSSERDTFIQKLKNVYERYALLKQTLYQIMGMTNRIFGA